MLQFVGFNADTFAQPEQITPDVSSEKVAIPDDSVLQLIPQDTTGIIYCPSLSELEKRIDMLVSELMPQPGSVNMLAKTLAGAFGAGFESLDELAEIGLDLNKDFAIFFSSMKPLIVCATVHLTDPESIKEVIKTEVDGSEPAEYNGVTYWSSPDDGGNFVIIGKILVYSQQVDVCKKVIDTHNETMPAITNDADNGMFTDEILNGTDQLGVYFDLEVIATQLGDTLIEALDDQVINLEDEEDPLTAAIEKMAKDVYANSAELIEQIQYLSATLQVEDADVQLKPFLKFKDDSKFLNEIGQASRELSNIEELPNICVMNAAFQGVPQLLVDISTFWIDVLPKDPQEQQKQLNPLFQEVKTYYESLADRWNMSVNFDDSIVPDYLFIYELKDEESAKFFMDEEFLEKLHTHHNAYSGETLLHNDVEIKSFIFPDFEMADETGMLQGSDMVPTEWHWHYAFTDGHLYFATGTSPDTIKSALDGKMGIGDKFSQNPSYQKLVENLGTDNNVFLAVSPIIAIKNMMPLLGNFDQQNAMTMQILSGFFTNLPDNYSVGFAAKTQNNGIDAKLILTLGDFKQLIQMFGTVFGGGMMQ